MLKFVCVMSRNFFAKLQIQGFRFNNNYFLTVVCFVIFLIWKLSDP